MGFEGKPTQKNYLVGIPPKKEAHQFGGRKKGGLVAVHFENLRQDSHGPCFVSSFHVSKLPAEGQRPARAAVCGLSPGQNVRRVKCSRRQDVYGFTCACQSWPFSEVSSIMVPFVSGHMAELGMRDRFHGCCWDLRIFAYCGLNCFKK